MVDNNNLEIPVLVTYYTNSRVLCTKEFGSFAHFGSVLSYFNNYIKRKGQTKLKKKYVLNNKVIDDNELLINIIQSINNNKKIIEANISLEIEEKIINISDNNFAWFSKILQPKLKPFEIIIFNPKDYSISLKKFPDSTIKEYELDKINENSAFCNSTKDLYISGGINNDDLSYFWIINNEGFNIRKIKMKTEKLNHSMIYINHNNDEYIFIAGGNDLKTFYYDIKFSTFVDWGYMNYSHIRPALIYVNDYLYCFDTSPKKGIIFERTNLNQTNQKWEKIRPDFQNGKVRNFSNFGFATNYCRDSKIMLCGGDSVNFNTYLYDIENNLLSENNKCEDILFTFNEKNFYRIDINNSIALPYSLNEEKEILLINNFNYSLDKIILNSNKKKKEEENKNNKYKIDYNKYLKNLSIGNVNIELKTKDIGEEDIKTEMDNQIDNNNNEDIDNLDNISYFEKEAKSALVKNEIKEIDSTIPKNMNDIKSVYIPNNDNYKNYKKIKKENNINNENDPKYIPKEHFDNFDNDDSNIAKEIKLNFNENYDFYEAEGNNFIYDSNSCKYSDIKANNDVFTGKKINIEKYIKKDNKKMGNNLKKTINKVSNQKNDNDLNINIINTDIPLNNDINNNIINDNKNIISTSEKKEENLIKNENNNDFQNEENEVENYNDFNHRDNEEQNIKKYEENELNEENDENGDKISNKNSNENIHIEDNADNNSDEGNFIEESIKNDFNENEEKENEDEEGKEINEINKNKEEIEENNDNNEDVEEYKDEMELEEKEKNSNEDNNDDINEEENIENNNEEKEGEGFQDRDRFQQTIIDPFKKDIIQIENYPLSFYYNENNFCDYLYKPEEINF